MYLRTYLAEKKLKISDLCKELGCTYAHLVGVKNGNRKASLRLAKAIERLTDGVVTTDELMFPDGKKE